MTTNAEQTKKLTPFSASKRWADDLFDDVTATTVGDGGHAQESTVHNDDSDDNEKLVPRCPLPTLSELFATLNDLWELSVEGSVTDGLHNVHKLRCLFASAG